MGKVFRFGSGNLYALDTSTVTPTPVKFGTLQEVSEEFSLKEVELFGQNKFADAVGQGEGKISCKAKMAQINGALLAMFFNVSPVTGQLLPVTGEAVSIPATPGPYTITVAHATGYYKDLGVIFAATGTPLTRVATGPATGQYSLVEATGIYTFAAADQGLGVKFDYLYNSTLVGKTLTIVNQEQGQGPSFMAILHGTFQNQSVVQILNKCTSSKLSFPYKASTFAVQEFDFSAQVDDAGNIGTMSYPG